MTPSWGAGRRVGIIGGPERGGHIAPVEAYARIKQAGKALKRTKRGLRFGEDAGERG